MAAPRKTRRFGGGGPVWSRRRRRPGAGPKAERPIDLVPASMSPPGQPGGLFLCSGDSLSGGDRGGRRRVLRWGLRKVRRRSVRLWCSTGSRRGRSQRHSRSRATAWWSEPVAAWDRRLGGSAGAGGAPPGRVGGGRAAVQPEPGRVSLRGGSGDDGRPRRLLGRRSQPERLSPTAASSEGLGARRRRRAPSLHGSSLDEREARARAGGPPEARAREVDPAVRRRRVGLPKWQAVHRAGPGRGVSWRRSSDRASGRALEGLPGRASEGRPSRSAGERAGGPASGGAGLPGARLGLDLVPAPRDVKGDAYASSLRDRRVSGTRANP